MLDDVPGPGSGEGPLRTDARRFGETDVLVVAGEIDLQTVDQFRVVLGRALRDAGSTRVIVDLTAMTYLGSHGLNALVDAASEARDRREPLRLVEDHQRPVVRPMEITGLDRVLALYESLDDALMRPRD